jgi:hypothetical protein
VQRGAKAAVAGVAGQHDGFPSGGPGDRALPGVVLAAPGVSEALGVVAELAEGAGRQDCPQTRLAEIDVSGRVPPKMPGHHFLQPGDLLVQGREHADLPGDHGRVRALGERRLAQPGSSQDPQQGAGPVIGVVAPRSAQHGRDLGPGQPRST